MREYFIMYLSYMISGTRRKQAQFAAIGANLNPLPPQDMQSDSGKDSPRKRIKRVAHKLAVRRKILEAVTESNTQAESREEHDPNAGNDTESNPLPPEDVQQDGVEDTHPPDDMQQDGVKDTPKKRIKRVAHKTPVRRKVIDTMTENVTQQKDYVDDHIGLRTRSRKGIEAVNVVATDAANVDGSNAEKDRRCRKGKQTVSQEKSQSQNLVDDYPDIYDADPSSDDDNEADEEEMIKFGDSEEDDILQSETESDKDAENVIDEDDWDGVSDEVIEWVKAQSRSRKRKRRRALKIQEMVDQINEVINDIDINAVHIGSIPVQEKESEYEDSDILKTPTNSDEEWAASSRKGKSINAPEFDIEKLPQIEEGMRYPDHKAFRKALVHYCVMQRIQFHWLKNEKRKMNAHCINRVWDEEKKEWKGCEWRIYGSTASDGSHFMVHSFYDDCKCPKRNQHWAANSNYYAEKFMDTIRDDPYWRVDLMKKKISRELELNASNQQLYRARRKAVKMIQGDGLEQFVKLWDYTHTLLAYNPGSHIKMKVKVQGANTHPTFKGLFISYKSVIFLKVAGQ